VIVADISDVLAGPWAGVGGFCFGFVIGARFRIVRRKEDD
jgi:hypothetical protein